MSGYGTALDANRQPNPGVSGELRAMQNALLMSGRAASSIDYVNTHGTGAVLGDQVETEALLAVGLSGVKANATKSLTGHGISSAGLVETVACLVQMGGGFLHPNPNLRNPITESIDWVGSAAERLSVRRILSNSFGFGGINSSVVLEEITDN
jgi:malonyl-ACP decarboxylase